MDHNIDPSVDVNINIDAGINSETKETEYSEPSYEFCGSLGCITVPSWDDMSIGAVSGDIINHIWDSDNVKIRLRSEVKEHHVYFCSGFYNNAQPGDCPVNSAAKAEYLHLEYDDLDYYSRVYWLTPVVPNGQMAIYHEGHGGTWYDLELDVINGLLDAGYYVAALSVPLYPPNSLPSGWDGHHENFENVERGLRYFMEPLFMAVDYGKYVIGVDRVISIGLSGGGWAVTLHGAIDSMVDAVYSVAGSQPLWINQQLGIPQDWEQSNGDGLYDITGYMDLYLMCAQRELMLIYNHYDTCCFRGEYSLIFDDYLKHNAENYQMVIDHTNNNHQISDFAFNTILSNEVGK